MKLATGGLLESFGPYALDKGAAFATFTTKKDVSPLPIPRIPAGRLEVNTLLMIEAEGEYSSLTGAALTLGLHFGTYDDAAGSTPTITTDIALSSVITTGTTPLGWPWHMRWRGKITKTGTTGSMVGAGELYLGTSLIALSIVPIPITLALRTVAIDTTVDRRIGVSATWGASSGSNTITTYSVTVCALN